MRRAHPYQEHDEQPPRWAGEFPDDIAAHAGARWVIVSTPAAQVSDAAGTPTSNCVQELTDRATTDPIAAPVASEGASMPPPAPARTNNEGLLKAGATVTCVAQAVSTCSATRRAADRRRRLLASISPGGRAAGHRSITCHQPSGTSRTRDRPAAIVPVEVTGSSRNWHLPNL